MAMELVSPELLRRFDISGPRYTSYPTADRFQADPKAQSLVRALHQRAQGDALPMSLYLHIPFCESVCYYCACNKVVTKDHDRAADYLTYLEREIDQVAQQLKNRVGKMSPVSQLHLGGGSPTFISDKQLSELVERLRSRFDFTADAECSIEVDPRTVSAERLAVIWNMGFNRISFGVQDFNPEVQEAVHRVQPFEQVKALVEVARDLGFGSINMDLIYGLPHQNPDTLQETIRQVLQIRPDRLALYAYAHLPARFKPQRRIDAEQLPTAEMKLAMLDGSIRTLLDAGYDYIGMDHFALPTDELAIAKREGRMQRNFQGYYTQAGSDLVGFGVSAISQVGNAYSQNVKTIPEYYQCIDQGVLPVERGLTLDQDDELRRQVIMSIMCQGRVDANQLRQQYGIEFAQYFAEAPEHLAELVAAGMVSFNHEGLTVSQKGWFFVRPIAMAFDKYLWLNRDHQRFSRVL
jgi:oxygen-independent coproporphyrinogen-3 oxidase